MHAQFAYACGCHYAAGVYQKWPSQDKKIDISSTSLLGLPFAVLFHHLLSKVLVGDSVNRCSKEVVVTSVCLLINKRQPKIFGVNSKNVTIAREKQLIKLISLLKLDL